MTDVQHQGEIIKRAKFPLMAALATVGFGTARQFVQRCIRTKFPKATQGKYVQGITGILGKKATIRGLNGVFLTFAKEATWEIRWDFSGLKEDGSLPESGILGAHVNLAIQDAVHRQKWAFYFPESSVFYKMGASGFGDLGQTYLHGIIEGVTHLAAYNFNAKPDPTIPLTPEVIEGYTWQHGTEAKGALAIAAKWFAEYQAYQRDL